MDPEAMTFIWEDVQYLTHQYVFYTHGRNLCDFLKSDHNEINLLSIQSIFNLNVIIGI